MPDEAKEDTRWYLYHFYKGKMVESRADHIYHLHEHHRGDKDYAGRCFAGSKEPLDAGSLERWAKHFGVEAKIEKGPALKPYTPREARKVTTVKETRMALGKEPKK